VTFAIQNIIVTIVMLGAVAVVVRRVFGSTEDNDSGSCPSCDSGKPCHPAGSGQTASPEPEVRPLTLIRPKR
jgi:hypothetical protein